MLASPFASRVDDYLAATASFCLVVVFLCCYAFKDAALVDLPDINERLSREQRRTYIVSSLTLTLVMLAGAFGTLASSLLIFAITFHQERLQRLREGFAPSAAVLARWRRARRLSLKEVLAEADAGAEFAWRHALEGRIAARLREAR